MLEERELGGGLVDGWVARGLLTETWELTETGRYWFTSLGVNVSLGLRPLLRPCIDWTVRRPHAAGALADRFAAAAFENGWAFRCSHPRSARLTPSGVEALKDGLSHDGSVGMQ